MRKLSLLMAGLILVGASLSEGAPLYSNVPASDVGSANTISEPNTSRTVAVSASGTILVAYHGASGIRVARSVNRGQSFSPSVQVTAVDAPVEVAISSSGVAYVAWVEANRATLSRSLNDGLSFSAPVDVGPMASSQVHMATSGQYVYMVAQSGINFLASSNSGASFSSVNVGSGDVFSDVRVDPVSGDVVVETDNPTLKYHVSTDHGASFGPAVTPGGSIFYSTSTLSAVGAGRYLFVSGAGTDAFRIALSAGTSTALTFGNNVPSQSRSLAADSCGNVVDSYSDGASTFYAVSGNLGNTFAPAVAVSGSSIRQSIAINPATRDIVAAYESGGRIFVSTFSGELPDCAPKAVPTLSEWGMILFLLLAGIGSVNYLRKEGRA